jgi:transposase
MQQARYPAFMDVKELPNDLDQLKQLVKEKEQTISDYQNKITDYRNQLSGYQERYALLDKRNIQLEERVKVLEMIAFGKGSEKWTPVENKQALLFDEGESNAPQDDKTAQAKDDKEPVKIPVKGHERTKKKPRKPDPWVERKEKIHDLPDSDKKCACGHDKQQIGEDQSQEMQWIPGHFCEWTHRFPKYNCPNCHGESEPDKPEVQSSPRPVKLLPKTITTSSLLAYLFAAKFEYALPYYRQEKFFGRLGYDLTRQNMSQWQIAVHQKLAPLLELFRKKISEAPFLGIDETHLQVMKENGKKNSTKSYMWVFRAVARDGPLIYFEYHPSRSGQEALAFLKDFSGKIQTDAYSGYNYLRSKSEVTAAGCWDHARREFYLAAKVSKSGSTQASQILEIIRKLYAIEDIIQGKPDEKKLAYRRQHSKPILDCIKNWLDDMSLKVLPKSRLGKAIAYTLGEWPYLTTFVDHGDIPLSNIFVENAIRPFVIGRKNWLFSGSPRGASASAFLYSLIESAKANDLDPYWYLVYLFELFPHAQNEEDLVDLLPNHVTQKDIDLLKNQMV